MDPVTISLIIGGIVTLTKTAMEFSAALEGQPLTDEQKQTLREQQKALVAAIDAATPVPQPED